MSFSPLSLPPPMTLTSSLLHCFCLHVRSKVRATGRAHREKKRQKRHRLHLLSVLFCASLHAPWWRWEWVEVRSQSEITSRWKLASKKVCFSQTPQIMMVPPEHTVELIMVNQEIISVRIYANSSYWRSVIYNAYENNRRKLANKEVDWTNKQKKSCM